jgi:hypothetical protein
MTLAPKPDNATAKKARIDEVQQLVREAEAGARRGKGEQDALLLQAILTRDGAVALASNMYGNFRIKEGSYYGYSD